MEGNNYLSTSSMPFSAGLLDGNTSAGQHEHHVILHEQEVARQSITHRLHHLAWPEGRQNNETLRCAMIETRRLIPRTSMHEETSVGHSS